MKSEFNKKINEVIEKYHDKSRENLIPILQSIQEKFGYIPKDAISLIGEFLNLSSSKIYGVATFYNQFKFNPPGKYHIQVCRGTACHVKGSALILDALQKELKINSGQTTRDGLFSLEVVACIGACGLAPVISINGEFHAKLTPKDIPLIIKSYRDRAKNEGGKDE
ncbi:MAG TPA: NADH-quinone oxidoreductase subunit NuoE [Victivallales bacterium]|nr:NADH-quinone oxidoreductase subunit NuoE [Victivallales bacterium]HPO91238.1 NADH-quinone oxidoreductase subunit NuoE [Victivallales bacterium]HRR06664.1 NADH-quinone oxidoreductase subunit NuoE [Victivallales bacterium]HRR27818.1 NADH-quinone oxidoreductase subunit NuoE [Victivallales bacterium]HRU01762.1 NADH-quinone oxidoreductase subunit NuoE [Victivallales bacterium]